MSCVVAPIGEYHRGVQEFQIFAKIELLRAGIFRAYFPSMPLRGLSPISALLTLKKTGLSDGGARSPPLPVWGPLSPYATFPYPYGAPPYQQGSIAAFSEFAELPSVRFTQ